MFSFDPYQIAITAVVILFVLTVHEFSHALAADALGDDTARRLGRLTLNPLAHLDFLGTALFFIAGFGWAKPVPVNPYNLRNPKKDMIVIAAAGPLSNLLTAIIGGFVIRAAMEGGLLMTQTGELVRAILVLLVFYSIALAVFNLIPIPPLDGSRILYGILPDGIAEFYARFEKVGMLVLFGIFIFAREGAMRVLWGPVDWMFRLFTGMGIF
ncbi:MAG: site-2 protease family protein [Candidatus Dadabacteria bacterium]|nr:site-2 protease family protein [Candidatus Dadabacteria bacterium]MCY4046784.1 site-2 protease family protein [Candidatus Dadabacteria bacterium]